MTELQLITAHTPEVIRFITNRLGIEVITLIFEQVVKNPVRCFTDAILNKGVTIEETARDTALYLIKQGYFTDTNKEKLQ